VKESNTMKGIASNTSFLPKTPSKKEGAVMSRDESHRQGRGLSFLQERHLRQIIEIGLHAVKERVVIDRSFVNCPTLRHSSKFSLIHFQ
jgi:hypothetical protein